MRISDWSSDVCSSDLLDHTPRSPSAFRPARKRPHLPPGSGMPLLPPSPRFRLAATRAKETSCLQSSALPQARFDRSRSSSTPESPGLRTPDAGRPNHFRFSMALSRSEEHTSELQSLMRNSYAVFCLKKKTDNRTL